MSSKLHYFRGEGIQIKLRKFDINHVVYATIKKCTDSAQRSRTVLTEYRGKGMIRQLFSFPAMSFTLTF